MIMRMITMIVITNQPIKLHCKTHNHDDDDWHDDDGDHDDCDTYDVNDNFDNPTHKTALQYS